MPHWTSAALMEPDMDLTVEVKMRSGIGVEGSSLRNGTMVTLMAPETELRRSSAGDLADDAAGWGIMVMLIEPDIVLMERRS